MPLMVPDAVPMRPSERLNASATRGDVNSCVEYRCMWETGELGAIA